ncbi:MAG: patatin-like phospholipase family protein, partial [Oscillospiraceae bacterium]|nr:patatin-like phospholipase family protein [Oscillospiraceae bacterium]
MKRAVVLAGGGSRGAYQIGVWQALRELKIDYQIVTGTSVGALNGAMMVQGDYDEARALWENITSSDVVSADFPEGPPDYDDPDWQTDVWGAFIKKAVQSGGLDFSPLEGLMQKYASEARLRASDIDFGVVTVEYPSMKPEELTRDEIPAGRLSDYIVASAACFPAFRVKEIGKTRYIDGGYQDNMPVNLAVRMGADEVIAVDLKSVGIRRKQKDTSVPVEMIRSRWDLGPFLLFEPTLSGRNISL